MFGLFILFLDLLWIVVWFGIAIWFEADASLPFPYRENIRDMLFHYANVGGIVYIINRIMSSKRSSVLYLSWFGLIPFAFAFFGDVQHLVSVTLNLSQSHAAAWGAFLALSIWALVDTVCGICYFFKIKFAKDF
jgi:hypothetical protein